MSEFEKQFPISEDDNIEDMLDNLALQRSWKAALKWTLNMPMESECFPKGGPFEELITKIANEIKANES